MSAPTLKPKQRASVTVLPITGTLEEAKSQINYAFGIYSVVGQPLYDDNFVQGAVDQVSYTYKKLGGDVLDIEQIGRAHV